MAKGLAAGLIDPSFCCCAVPLVNAGIYAIIIEQGIVALGIGLTALFSPDVLGAAFPKFAKIIFAIVCIVVAVIQPIGFIGVLREKTSTFKAYALANSIAIAAALSTGAALIAVSAARHNVAVAACQVKYFTNDNSTTTSSTIGDAASSTLSSEGEALCSPFAWADVGIMGGIWLLLLIVQGYYVFVTRSYSKVQVKDHKLYHSVYSENPEAFTMSVLRSSRYNPGSVYNPPQGPHADAWDTRPSMDSVREESGPAPGYGYGHGQGLDGRDGGEPEYGYAGAGAGSHEMQRPYSGYDYGQRGGRYEDADHHDGNRAYPNTYDGYDQSGGGDYGQYPSHRGYGDEPPPHDGSGGYPFSTPGGGYVNHLPEAMSRDPGTTPTLNQYSSGQGVGYAGDGGLRRPEGVQGHPAEGMFGRKSPRLQ